MIAALRRLRNDESATSVVADMIVTPIFFILFFGMVLFMFYLRSQVFVYEAVYLGLSAAQGAVGLDPDQAGALGVRAIEHFLDATDVVTLRDAQVTVTRDGSLWRIESYVYGGWEPGPILNMSRETTVEICLRARDRLNTFAVDAC